MPAGKEIRVNIVPDTENAPDRIYANVAMVSHSPFDFTISFLEFIPMMEHEADGADKDEKGALYRLTPIVARIALKPELVPLLINVLKENYEIYKKIIEDETKKGN